MKLELDGLTVLVTGGSRGIGQAIVKGFYDEGCKVAFCSRKMGDINEYFPGADKARLKGTELDVRDLGALKKWIEDSATEFGGVDIVINNVSYVTPYVTLDDWRINFETDMLPYVTLVDTTIPMLRKSKNPVIISIGSESGMMINKVVENYGPGPYGAIKAAVMHYTQQVATRYAREGIRVNSVSPAHIYHDGAAWKTLEETNPTMFNAVVKEVPMERMGYPEEVANMVVFMASKKCAYAVGTNIRVSGGNTRGFQL